MSYIKPTHPTTKWSVDCFVDDQGSYGHLNASGGVTGGIEEDRKWFASVLEAAQAASYLVQEGWKGVRVVSDACY